MGLLANSDVAIAWVRATHDGPLYRNASGDELVYVQEGTATLESVFGCVAVGPGDYVVIPSGVTHRWTVVDGFGALFIEASGHVGPPRRYLSGHGQFLEHAPFCERDLRTPTDPLVIDGSDVEVLVRTVARLVVAHPTPITRSMLPVGDGCIYPWVFNISDFEPIVGSIHQPPPVHQTFRGPRGLLSAPSCRGCSTSTPTRSRCPTTTPTSTVTRSCSTRPATS